MKRNSFSWFDKCIRIIVGINRKSACQYFVMGFAVTEMCACHKTNTDCKYSISVGVGIAVFHCIYLY